MEVGRHISDFFDGLKSTFIDAQLSFGDFLGRISGFRDWQQETKFTSKTSSTRA